MPSQVDKPIEMKLKFIPLGCCVEEQLEFHEIWVLETYSAGLRRDILDVFAAEQTPRKGPIVFIASNVKSIFGRLMGCGVY